MAKQIVHRFVMGLLLVSIFALVINVQEVSAPNSNDNTAILNLKEKRVNLSFPRPEAIKIGGYYWLRIENCSYFTVPSQPMLPVRSFVMKFPEKSIIRDVSVNVDEVLLEGSFSILPVPSPTIVGVQDRVELSEDPTIYRSKNSFPNAWYVQREANGIDVETTTRVKYLILNLFPLKYLPAENKVLRAENVSITVTYIERSDISGSLTRLKNLIIASPTLETYAHQLALWKNSTGTSSKVLNTTWIYSHYSGVDNQEKIRNCIKDSVATYGIIYVTIFGDADQVPVRYAYVPDGQDTYTPTDLYYADLDGTWDDNGDKLYADQRYDYVDGIPDVYIGRIPPSVAQYAQVAVDKIKGYQQQYDGTQGWARRIVLSAGTGHNGIEDTLGNATTVLKEYIARIVNDKKLVKLYESAGNLSTASMASEINQGALFVNFAGHGDPGKWLFYWVIPGLIWNGFGISNVQSLTNGFKLPVVTTMSCSTARFDDQDCIGEWFVLEPDGGSIAYFGATRISWGYPDGWSPYGLMGEIDWRIYENFFEGHTRLGQMWGETVMEYVESHIWNYKSAWKYDVKTFMEFVLLGDPTLKICPTIFEDDFESGSFNTWSGTSRSSGETTSVVNTLVHHGAYSGKFTSNGGASNEYAYCYKNIMPLSELYVRGNFYVATYGIAEDNDRFYFLVMRGALQSNRVAYAGWRKVGGVVKWCLVIRHGTSNVVAYSTTSPSRNRWYCVEVHWFESATVGYGKLWVNGILVCSIAGKNTAYCGHATRIDFGLPYIVGCNATKVYGDCCAVARAQIGPEPPNLFQDGFEHGNFNQWSGKSVSLGETAIVTNALSHHSTYSAMFTSNGNGGSERAYCYKTIPASTELYARGYFKVTTSGIADNYDRFYFVVFRVGSNTVAKAGWKKTGGVVKWNLLIRNGTGWVQAYSSKSPSLNQWYSVELHWRKSVTAGYAELWIDGALLASVSNKNTAYYGDVNRVDLGLAELVNCNITRVYSDCTAISTTYIGPEMLDEWFSSVSYIKHHYEEWWDGELYEWDELEIKVDVHTTDGTLNVTVYAYIIGKREGQTYEPIEGNPTIWTITGTGLEYHSITLTPWGGDEDWFDVQLYLYDNQGNLEDYRYDSEVAYLVGPPE